MITRLSLILGAALVLLASVRTPSPGEEKLKFGTSIRVSPVFYLPMLAAEEKGLWRENGLAVDWIPFEGTAPLFRGLAARAINIGAENQLSQISAIARGLPIIAVSDMERSAAFAFWVLKASAAKEAKDLKGAKVAVTTLGGPTHAYAVAITGKLGLENKVKFVSAGGVPSQIAALKARAVEAVLLSHFTMARLKENDEVREVVSLEPYLPKPWIGTTIAARKDFVKASPEITKKAVKALVQSTSFLINNESWAVQKIMSGQQVSYPAAKDLYGRLQYTSDGKLSREALENVRRFAIDFSLVKSEETPRVEELFTKEFTE